MAIDADGISSTTDISEKWNLITRDEILGNKEKGIRGRHDARVGTNIILAMPNSYTAAECLESVKKVISKTPAAGCYWSAWVHAGKKNGIENQHVHLSINERLKSTGKKDRTMQRKGWFQDVFMKSYREEIKEALELAPKRAARERISMELVQSDLSSFQNAVRALNRPKLRYYGRLSEDGSFRIHEDQFNQAIFQIMPNGELLKNLEYNFDQFDESNFEKLIPNKILLKMEEFKKQRNEIIQKSARQAPKVEPKNHPEKPKFKMRR